jgi:CubicO group peptidase (beta-lactamase class C family)
MILRSTIVFLLLFVCTRGAAQSANVSKERLQIDSLLKTIYKTDAPGISISIIQKGKLIFKNNYGVAALETKKDLNSKTNFNIGSLTKQFTALAILQLAESKKLSLDDHLDKFFPGLDKKVAETVTVNELLTHSSGIIDHYDLSDTKNLKHAHISDVLNAIQNTDSTYFVPGSHFRYSNTAYCLLSLIIEKISGMSYAQYLKENIFIPLGMKKTTVWNEKEKIENEALGYEFDKTTNSFKRSGASENIFFSTEGDGGIYTSVDDYLKWFAALQAGNIFSKEMAHQALSPQFSIDKENRLSYGYGWFIDESSVPGKVYHSGSNGGFRSYSFSIPEKNFLIVVFSNRDDVDLEKLIKKIYTMIAPWLGYNK